MNVTPLILLPGMGADERLFRLQKIAFPHLLVPRWISPLRDESLPAYAARFARHIDPGVPFFVGGVSLGGMIAAEMARQSVIGTDESPRSPRSPVIKACFLIASIRGPQELPRRAMIFRHVMPLAMAALTVAPLLARVFHFLAGWAIGRNRREILRQLADADGAFLRWATRAMLTWSQVPEKGVGADRAKASVPVFQIHGTGDRILPIRLTQPDQRVEGGGHIDLSLSHADKVNEFLNQHLVAGET